MELHIMIGFLFFSRYYGSTLQNLFLWNCDEFASYYCMYPSSTIGPRPISGKKKGKSRVTVLACLNSNGTEKFLLFVVGSTARPRCFSCLTPNELKMYYRNSRRERMTTNLFFEWLKKLDSYIAGSLERKILLLAVNTSCHCIDLSLPAMHNIRIKLLSPRATSLAHPSDAGIIASVKRKFKSRQIHRILQITEESSNRIRTR